MLVMVNGEVINPDKYNQILESVKLQDHTLTQEEAQDRAVYLTLQNFFVERETNEVFADIPENELNEALRGIKDAQGGEELFYRNLGLTKDDDETIKKDLNQQLKIERFILDLTKDLQPPSDKMAKQYYDKNPLARRKPERRHAYNFVHKFSPNEMPKIFMKMMSMREKVLNGVDFLTLAKKESTCENPDLGYFARGEMVEEFDTIVFSMKVGETSPIFLTQFGYHLVKLIDIEPAKEITFEDAKAEVKEMFLSLKIRLFKASFVTE
jgi:hypothetical protein